LFNEGMPKVAARFDADATGADHVSLTIAEREAIL
jgi:hypothetical protein